MSAPMTPEEVREARPVTVSEREKTCLGVLVEYHESDPDFCCLDFATIQGETRFDRSIVRRSVRSLARKGLAEFHKGLCDADGAFFGSGYCCTKAGRDFYRTQFPRTDEDGR
jgi:hypothetical protein